jgi:hypothetical protein
MLTDLCKVALLFSQLIRSYPCTARCWIEIRDRTPTRQNGSKLCFRMPGRRDLSQTSTQHHKYLWAPAAPFVCDTTRYCSSSCRVYFGAQPLDKRSRKTLSAVGRVVCKLRQIILHRLTGPTCMHNATGPYYFI